MITNKAAYMDDKTWAKVGKVVAPGIRKMTVSKVDFVWHMACSRIRWDIL